MAPQTPTKHVSHQIQKKPETTPPPPPSQAHLPTPSPSPLSHTRKQQRHHHVRFNLAAVSNSFPQTSQSRIQISSDKPSQSKSSDSPTSLPLASEVFYTASFSCPANLSGPLTPPRSEQRPSPKFIGESVSSSPSPPSSSESTTRKEGTDQGPPCNNCHQPSTLCTVGPLNPKGNAGRKYFACRRCPYGLAWVGWAHETAMGVAGGDDQAVGAGSRFGGNGGVDDGSHDTQDASGKGSFVSLNRGSRWGVSSPGSQRADDDRPMCCCGEMMKLEYVDFGWDVTFGSPSEERKKWFWTCALGGCEEFVWVEDTIGFAPGGRSGGGKRTRNSVRILW